MARGARQLWRYLRTAARLVLRRPLVSVVLVPSLADGRIVLVRRVDTGEWCLPGGLVDWGETVEAAARRELREETGLELLRVDRLVGVYSAPDRDPRIHAVSITLAVAAGGAMEVHDELELSGVRAFGSDAIPYGSLAHDHDRQIRDHLEDRTALR